jgi:hypothetical protein
MIALQGNRHVSIPSFVAQEEDGLAILSLHLGYVRPATCHCGFEVSKASDPFFDKWTLNLPFFSLSSSLLGDLGDG